MPAMEVLVSTGRVFDKIADSTQTHELEEIIADGEYYGMQTFDQSLLHLYATGGRRRRDALSTASNPHDLRLKMEHYELAPGARRAPPRRPSPAGLIVRHLGGSAHAPSIAASGSLRRGSPPLRSGSVRSGRTAVRSGHNCAGHNDGHVRPAAPRAPARARRAGRSGSRARSSTPATSATSSAAASGTR